MKIIATIEARMSSSRLPGKVLLPILGKPMLELMIERVLRAQSLNQVVVATTTNPADDEIELLARRMGVGFFRGSESDVLNRVLGAAQSVGADVIVELTGDCPLADPALIDRLVNIYQANDFDYVANTLTRTWPRGLDTQVFSTATLALVSQLTQDPVDHEHVSLYIYEHPERFRLRNVVSDLAERYWDLRLTVDTLADFKLIEIVYQNLYPQNSAFALRDVLALFDAHPELAELNREVKQKQVR